MGSEMCIRDRDEFVPTQMTLDNYSACAGPKELLIVPEAGHGTSNFVEPERYRETALRFMKKYSKCSAGQRI